MTFLSDDFLLSTPVARDLYHGVAARQPVIDYHNHLSPKDIAEDRRFDNLAQIWLEGDHYKWRAMRANGVPEELITGKDTGDFEKFKAWAGTVPHTLRNPLYVWTHLELRRHFGIGKLLDESTAESVWHEAGEQLAHGPLTARGILKKMNVEVICTTDDPADDLVWHRRAAMAGLTTRVLPTFRPDLALGVDNAAAFNAWCDRLGALADTDIRDLDTFVGAFTKRHDAFHATGCRLSDHGLETPFATDATEPELSAIFAKVRAGADASPQERQKFGTFVMLLTGRLDAARGWTMQLHIGAIRNLNTRLLARLGADAGADARVVPRPVGFRGPAAQNDLLQPESGGQRRVRRAGGDLQRRLRCGQGAVGLRLVVPRSGGGHARADRGALAARAALEIRRHADGFEVVPLLPASRIFPAHPLLDARLRCRHRPDTGPAGQSGAAGRRHLPRQRGASLRVRSVVDAEADRPQWPQRRASGGFRVAAAGAGLGTNWAKVSQVSRSMTFPRSSAKVSWSGQCGPTPHQSGPKGHIT